MKYNKSLINKNSFIQIMKIIYMEIVEKMM